MNTDRIRICFGRFAKTYDKHMEKTNHLAVQTQIMERFLPLIRGRMLDIATGTGTIARMVKARTKALVHGLDFSPEMIAQAKKSSPDILFQVGDAHALPYPNGYFDVITCSYGFYWFDKQCAVISEIKRVMKPGGVFILLEEEFRQGAPVLPTFSQESGYLAELASLEDYAGVDALKTIVASAGFVLEKEVSLPIDNVHHTVGMMYRKN
jgi:ubiquinone/menaquinone biosynthesis C-methylase UbiE